MIHLRLHRSLPLLGAVALALASAGGVAAHVIEHAGWYTVALGWQHEPTYVGEQNAVQVIVTDRAGKAVTDLGPDDLKIVVSTGDQQSGPLTFVSGFDSDTGLGTPGEYDAALLPTAIGDYTFHLTGTIHGASIDVTESSSDKTFDSVTGPADVEFPARLPTMNEVATRLDRIDARVAALGSNGSAQAAADRALLVGSSLGVMGIVVGLLGLIVGRRANRALRANRANAADRAGGR